MCGGATVLSGHQFFVLPHTTHPYPPINSVTACFFISDSAKCWCQSLQLGFNVIGMPLKYAQLMPACFTYSDAKILTEKCATPILKQVKSDFTRYWYGDEQHLDESWKQIFLYDHCRQKKEDFAATCKNLKKGKPCPIKYCHKCLLTSLFNLQHGPKIHSFATREFGKESCIDTNDAPFQEESKPIEEEILLPPDKELKEIFGIEVPSKDVGNALQLLEFCKVFGKALDLKEGEAEAILEELVCKQNMHGENTFLIEFHIRVLDLILNNSRNESPSLPTRDGNNSWLKHVEDLIMKSYHILNDFPLDWLQEGIGGYYKLDLSKKFKLMTFLCDEALNTEKLRSYIHEENSRHAKEVKEAKHKVAATKEKVKCLEKKLRSEKAKVVHSTVSPFPMEEHEALLSKIRIEVDEAHTDMLGLKGITQKAKLGCDALRIKPEFVDNNGQAFWNFRSCSSEYTVILQEIKIEDEIAKAPEEKWYVYGPDKKEEVHKYISKRSKRLNRRKVSHELLSEASL
ncbi:hypothetical protein ACSQ67_008602 [Phaseolus vulgaris]